MSATLQLGDGNWAGKSGGILGYHTYQADRLKYLPNELTFTRASTATYVDRDGLIKTAASGVPRIDFLNNAKGQLLLEPQRTNLVTYSEQLSSWTNTYITVTDNSVISPDGTTNASEIKGNVGVNLSKYNLITTTSVIDTYTFTSYVKYGTQQIGRAHV